MQREGIAARALRARLAKEGRPPTLMEVAVIRVGVVRGAEALWALMLWTMARRKAGGEAPDNVALMAMGRTSRQSAWRMRTLLVEVFGDEGGIIEAANLVEATSGQAIDDLLAFEGGEKAQDMTTAVTLLAGLPSPVGVAV